MQANSLVLVVRHVPFEHLGYLADLLDEHALLYRYVEIGEPISRNDIASAAALVVMGGPLSANDAEPWVDTEITAIRTALEFKRPILGICLGAQLLARALTARVMANPVKEIGWSEVFFTPAAEQDPLLAGVASPAHIFQWHGDTFELPHGAHLLAYTSACAHQAFRVRTNVYGFQFHLEVTRDMISEWCEQDANSGDIRELTSPIDPGLHAASQQQLARLIFGRWIRAFLLD